MIEIPEKEHEKPDDTIQSRIYRSKYSGSQTESRIPLWFLDYRGVILICKCLERGLLIGDDYFFAFEVFVSTFTFEIVSERDLASLRCPDTDDGEVSATREIAHMSEIGRRASVWYEDDTQWPCESRIEAMYKSECTRYITSSIYFCHPETLCHIYEKSSIRSKWWCYSCWAGIGDDSLFSWSFSDTIFYDSLREIETTMRDTSTFHDIFYRHREWSIYDPESLLSSSKWGDIYTVCK